MASCPIASWEIDRETVETVADFIFWAPKSLQMVIAAMKLKDTCSLEGPLQCSCLENPRDGRAWWAAVYGVIQSQTRLKQLNSSKDVFNYFIHLKITHFFLKLGNMCFLPTNRPHDIFCFSFTPINFNLLPFPRHFYCYAC